MTQTALITGAGSGIGRATCELLASLGATVVGTDIDAEQAGVTSASLAGVLESPLERLVVHRGSFDGSMGDVLAARWATLSACSSRPWR